MTRYDLWLESGPVDALTAAELAAEREDEGHYEEVDEQNPDEAYEAQRDREWEDR